MIEKLLRVATLMNEGKTNQQIADELGVTTRTVFNYKKMIRDVDQSASLSIDPHDVSYDNPQVIAQIQRLRDSNNLKNKVIREGSRQWNCQTELAEAIRVVLSQHQFSPTPQFRLGKVSNKVGVIQLSDVHFNELIHDIAGNRYDFEVASARIRKLIRRSIETFVGAGISSVVVFMTGDLLNSDRRLDEITSAATNRSNAIFIAVDILQQAINELLVHFNNVTIASVAGNESRVGKDVHWSDFLAGDSYDIVIHNMLSFMFAKENRVKFIPVNDPMECVVRVLNTNFLLVHGNGHRGLSSTSNIEREVQNIKANYAASGVVIDYVVCGHIHQAFVSDCFSRSSGLPGKNSYSSKALNLQGKASQNIFIVSDDGSIDGIKVDLQTYDLAEKYDYIKSLESYNNHREPKTVVIQSVLI